MQPPKKKAAPAPAAVKKVSSKADDHGCFKRTAGAL
jgi:hypothetical protein